MQATHTVTHTKSYQVIHQVIGTNNVHILRETARAEKAEPALPAPPRTAPHIFPYPGPQPAPRIPARGDAARTALSGPKPAPPRNK